MASKSSNRKSAKIQDDITYMNLPKKVFQNIEVKVKSRTWMTEVFISSHLPPHFVCGYPWNNIIVFYWQSRYTKKDFM